MKHIVIGLILINLLAFNTVNADIGSRFMAQIGTVGVADLDVENPGLLPTNPFYFLKEWGRGIRRFFTFNSTAQAELELEFVNEKAAELKKIEETRPGDLEAIVNALKKYQISQKRLSDKFKELNETSANPNIGKLLDKFATRALQHEKILSELRDKFTNEEEVNKLANSSIETIEESAAAASLKDEPDVFASRFEKAVRELKEDDIKNSHSRAIEVIEGVRSKVSKSVKASLKALQEELQNEVENIDNEKNFNDEKEKVLDSFFEESKVVETVPIEKEMSCPEIQIKLDELWQDFKSKLINDEDYNKQYEDLKNRLDKCLEKK